MPQSRSAQAKNVPEPEVTPQEAEGNVVEVAKDRESMRTTMSELSTATARMLEQTTMLTGKVEALDTARAQDRELHDRMAQLLESQGEQQAKLSFAIDRTLTDRIERLQSRLDDLETQPPADIPARSEVKEQVKDTARRARDSGESIAKRTWWRVKRETKPGMVRHDHIKGLIVGNLCEYFALVGAAQVAPVAMGNAITSVLFL